MSQLARVADEVFFQEHPDRQFRIRMPAPGERLQEFRSLGANDPERRRIIVWKVPVGSRLMPGSILCIPMLLFADETIRDDDATLGPIFHELMVDAAGDYDLKPPVGRS